MDTQPGRLRRRMGRSLSIRWPIGRRPSGIVLVLHGGAVSSQLPTTDWQPAVLRLTWLAHAIWPRLLPQGIVVARLRFAVRGWNGAAASPVADAVWAIAQLRELVQARYGRSVPIVLAGHSMGGRTAVRAAGEPGVTGVVALAPWLPPGEPVKQLAGRRLFIAHGNHDRITSPAESAAFAARAKVVAGDVRFEEIDGDGHAMVRRAGRWHRLTADQARSMIALAPPDASRALDPGMA